MKSFLSFFICSLFIIRSFSQVVAPDDASNYSDIITLQTGEDIKCSVLEVGVTEIKYKKEGVQPIYTIRKEDVFSISYPNGSKDVFTKIVNEEIIEEDDFTELRDLHSEGMDDANLYYPQKHTGSGGTFLTTFLVSPLFGLIPAIVCSTTVPSDFNLNIPDQEISIGENESYLRGYKEEALRIKSKKVWGAYGAGCGLWIIFIITYATVISN